MLFPSLLISFALLPLHRYDIQGFPTLKFFPAGSSEPEPYEGARELESLVDFINSKAGTQRTADGGLLPTAGRLEAFDAVIAAANYEASDALVTALQSAADAQKAAEGDAAATPKQVAIGADYVATAKKVVSKGGAAYVSKELKRLEGMINGKSIVPEKKTAFQLRHNLLAAFQVPVVPAAEVETAETESEL